MADLVGKKRSEPSRLVGADPVTGDESNFVGATSNNDLMVTDVPNTSGLYGTISVGTTPVELKVGAVALANRKIITVQPKGTGVFFGYDASVTTATGSELFKNQTLIVPAGGLITVYLVASAGTVDVRIGELA
jgi:hypothetical protein